MIPPALLNYQKLTQVRKEPKRKDNFQRGLGLGWREDWKLRPLFATPLREMSAFNFQRL